MTSDQTPEIVEQLFAAFQPPESTVGGMSRLAEALEISVKTVHSWKRIGIPAWRRKPIVAKALEGGIQLSDTVLDYLDPDREVKAGAPAPSAEALAAAGIAQSAAHAESVREGWGKDAAVYLAKYVAETPGKFLGEDVKRWAYDQGLDQPANEGAWGAVMRGAARNKIIVPAGYGKSKSASRHGSPNRLWKRG